jgi:hypothetical protein
VVDASFLCHYHIVWGPWTSRDALCFLGNVTPYLLLGDLGTGTRGFKERKRLGPLQRDWKLGDTDRCEVCRKLCDGTAKVMC